MQDLKQLSLPDSWDRFHEAFKLMAADFIDIMIHDRIVEMDITNALKATEATSAFSASFGASTFSSLAAQLPR